MMEYNGWSNWETWNFKLWLDNEESSYLSIMKLARGKTTGQLSLELENRAENIFESVGLESGFFADVCKSSIKVIDFYEIAESYLLALAEGSE